MTIRLAVDCMGGDYGIPVTLPAVVSLLDASLDVSCLLVGIESKIAAWLDVNLPQRLLSRVQLVNASQVVQMDELPRSALRQKRDSSLARVMELVRDGKADACVSAGNTGALMVFAYFIIKTFNLIERPAIATMIPTLSKPVCMLDLGANVDCRALHLFQFAVMGSLLTTAITGINSPLVGLLNVGDEEIKGNSVVKEAAQLIRRSDLNFYGSIEGSDIFDSAVDVVVCDGFVGNIVLKSSEGLVRMLSTALKREFAQNWYSRLAAGASYPVLKRFRRQFDHRNHNGACLVGLRSLVVKSHGSADAYAFEQSLHYAAKAVRGRFLSRLEDSIAKVLDG
ncbi:phosphate acyltransferase PlsX [Candidatus Ichthyocystis hellenicum]|uniref:phosphate acyltransferase PlsX n=1 Tax=Candidatus Ichthyocystis hellenicum TaxID=1561003 RepID=UPI000AAFBD85|nr:phosphate acyltransferase PlsX [Candidatus Ichthyocystis hellenicum]